jgi:hypothetical protein
MSSANTGPAGLGAAVLKGSADSSTCSDGYLDID